MNLLLTGGAGFIGSNVIQHVIERPEIERLINLDALTYAGHLVNLAPVSNHPKYVFEKVDLRDKAAVLVGCTSQEIANFVERALKEFDISREQLSVIHYLDSAGADTMTVNQLRETLLDDSPNVSRILNKMVEKGLVRKERQTDDQRVVYVSLTEKGRQLHKQADEKIRGHNLKLSPKECQTLIELMMKI